MIRAPYLAAAVLFAAPAFAEPAPALKPVAQPVAAQAVRIDVNTATADQLAAIKGLDRPAAEAIVKGRPYKSLDDLTKNRVLGETVFAQVKDRLTVVK